MGSVIPGFEYDIFISYRQKDNKGEKWVSEFVENLKTELASTFKEDISIYFDVSPHDGLLETHDVDSSLREKLKCLVFIPVLSRTYCDPQSFAWKNEFEAFIQMASKDKFGIKVNLPGGKEVSRVLPIIIHDQDNSDIKLFESVAGEFPGGVKFIYKSNGVNRPLRSQEDKPFDNNSNTFYRDQLSVVGFAIREIIFGMKGQLSDPTGIPPVNLDRKVDIRENKKLSKSLINKLLVVAVALSILMVAVIIFFKDLASRRNLSNMFTEDGRLPIVIMPFKNMTNDTLWNVWQEGIQYNLINALSNIKELHIRQMDAIEKVIRGEGLTDHISLTPSFHATVSKSLNANTYITGSIKLSGNTLRINAGLINSNTGRNIKSFQVDGNADSILSVTDLLSKEIQDYLLISVMKKKSGYDFDNVKRHFLLTRSAEAFRYFMYSDIAFRRGDMVSSRDWGMKALAVDTNFVTAMRGICYTYKKEGIIGEAKKWCVKAYNKRDQLSYLQKLWIEHTYASFFETPNEELNYLRQIDEYDPQSGVSFMTGAAYFKLQQFDKAVIEFEKWQEYLKLHSEPWESNDYSWLTFSYIKTGQFEKAKKMIQEAEKIFPDNKDLIEHMSIVLLALNDTISVNRYIDKYISLCREQSYRDAQISKELGFIYSEAGIPDKAEMFFSRSLYLEPGKSGWMNVLANFLITTNRNIEEGIKLIERSLQIRPDYYYALDIKGWGLYKLGKYNEALKLLEKADSLKPEYNHNLFLHLEAAKKAVEGMKN
jgi:tetratricopeptide (TPR) repeat protein/TolB-like protein